MLLAGRVILRNVQGLHRLSGCKRPEVVHGGWQVRQVAAEAIARARRGEGPTLIEAETYRFRGHSLADPDELRSKEEKDYYLVRCTCRLLRALEPSRLLLCLPLYCVTGLLPGGALYL